VNPRAVATFSARVWQLRYLLIGHYPDFAYCDPDYYPVARRMDR
jgi:site-specific DNA-adenine methylase